MSRFSYFTSRRDGAVGSFIQRSGSVGWIIARARMKLAIYPQSTAEQMELEMWDNAQRDGRPAEYRWRPLFNAAVCLTPTTTVPCSNAAKTRNAFKLPGVPQTNETISAASGPKFTIL